MDGGEGQGCFCRCLGQSVPGDRCFPLILDRGRDGPEERFLLSCVRGQLNETSRFDVTTRVLMLKADGICHCCHL